MFNLLHTIKVLRQYIVFWLGQTLSQIGSSLSNFAIILWVYEQTKSPLSVALLSVFIWVPRIIFGLFVGSIVDRADKKVVILISDTMIAIMSCFVFFLVYKNSLQIWHIYLFNIVVGFFSAFQKSASEVVQTALVPQQYYVATSGMRSFSSGASDLFAPILGAALYIIAGLKIIILVDICTFLIASTSLIVFVKIPRIESINYTTFSFEQLKTDLIYSTKFIKNNALLSKLMIYFCFVNLLSGITYFCLLSPMILARTGNNANILALVNTMLGFGVILGSSCVTLLKQSYQKIKIVCIAVGLSFMLGDILLAVGNIPFVWYAGAFFAGFFIPISDANEGFIWRSSVPIEFQGRILSSKDAIQTAMRPIGMLFGGIFAQVFFEPLVVENSSWINVLVGSGAGSGMAFMFLITGVLGSFFSFVIFYKFKQSLNYANN